MFKSTLKRAMRRFGRRYDYDVGYMEHFIDVDSRAFFKFSKVQAVSSYRAGIPLEPWCAAGIRTVLAEDCGPCTQLGVNMALEAGVAPERVEAVIKRDLDALPRETQLVIRFTELVLAHDPEADVLRNEIVALWGERALISLAMAISATRIYPTLKYVLGYGKACSRLNIEQRSVSPVRSTPVAASA